MLGCSASTVPSKWVSTSGSHVPQTLGRVSVEVQTIFTDVLRFVELNDGWDSYRAPRPSSRSVVGAMIAVAIIGELQPDAVGCIEVTPSLDGGVEIAIEFGDRVLDVTFNNKGSARLQFGSVDVELPAIFATLDRFEQELKRALDWLSAN